MKTFIFWLLCLTVLTSYKNSNEIDMESQTSKKPNNLIEQKEVQIQQVNYSPEYLYRIVSPEQWQEILLQNHVVNSPLDKDFIHLATEEQLANIAQKFWKNKEHIILKLASKKLIGHLVYETNPGGTTLYYHLYKGQIPLDAVIEFSIVHTVND